MQKRKILMQVFNEGFLKNFTTDIIEIVED